MSGTQDEAAMLVARVVDPRPGETVIDVGAAPGGKTTHLAALMGNEGAIWAVDRAGSRLKLLSRSCMRCRTSRRRRRSAAVSERCSQNSPQCGAMPISPSLSSMASP